MVGQPHPPLQSHTVVIRYVNASISVIPSDHPTDNVGASTAFQIVYRQLCIPARALNRVLQRMKSNRAGSILCLPRPNYYSVEWETPQMHCVLLNLSPKVSDSIKDADKLGGLVEDIRDVIMYYHVHVLHWSSPPCPIPAPDPVAK